MQGSPQESATWESSTPPTMWRISLLLNSHIVSRLRTSFFTRFFFICSPFVTGRLATSPENAAGTLARLWDCVPSVFEILPYCASFCRLPEEVRQTPRLAGDPGGHRGGHADALVHPAEVVIREVQGQRGAQVR